jgi:lysozyme
MGRNSRSKRLNGKKRRRIVIIVALILGLLLAGFWVFERMMLRKAHFVHYKEFGIEIPDNYRIHGIDVSHHQSYIDWENVKAMQVKKVKIGFAFIKATEGLGRVDGQFRRNWIKAKEAGLPRGAYHFFLAHKSGVAQAENFLSTVEVEKGDLPPVLDVEELYGASPEQCRKRCKEWLTTVEKAMHVKPIIYSGVDFYKRNLGADFDQYPLWAAHYYQKARPDIERNWIFWQHNENGHVNGILSRVDFNVFYGDSSAFKKLLVR